MAKVVYLSPSNHGVGQNKCCHAGCYEDKHTRPIAEACAKYLKQAGAKVYIADANTSMASRCKESDKVGADLHMPVHTNAFSDKSVRRLVFMCWDTAGEYKKMFSCMESAMSSVYDGDIKLAKRTDLYEIKVPKAKTLYCELGFHTNQHDCDNFIHKPEEVGKALADGICNYLGIGGATPTPPATTSTSKSISEIAKEVISGAWGDGNERKAKIQSAGYDYSAVQAEVNRQLGVKTTTAPKANVKLAKGASIKIKQEAKDLNSGKAFFDYVYNNTYTVIEVSGDRVVFGVNNAITGVVSKAYVTLV